MAVSFDSKTVDLAPVQRQARDDPGDEAAQQQVEAELAGQRDQPEDEHDGDPHRELAARLERSLEQRPARASERTETSASEHGEGDEGEQDHRLVSGWVGREEQRDRAGSARTRRPRRRRAGRCRSGSRSSPASRRIGIRVPIAVVAIAEPE